MLRGALVMERDPVRVEHPEVADQRLQPALAARRADDEIGLYALTAGAHHVTAVEALEPFDDRTRPAFRAATKPSSTTGPMRCVRNFDR